MPSPDPAKAIKDALAGHWSTAHPAWIATLQVDDDFAPTATNPALLVADDGGPRLHDGPWVLRQMPSRRNIRLTSFATGRTQALTVIDDAIDYLVANHPAPIARIENVPDPQVTLDRATGAVLAFLTMPVIVKPPITA